LLIAVPVLPGISGFKEMRCAREGATAVTEAVGCPAAGSRGVPSERFGVFGDEIQPFTGFPDLQWLRR